ncbi:MAG: glycosyl hydrolase family 18 protein, partial [Acidobacteriota bacterium]|nr:glycosyl hydrolase family 18 protein [Acidobacteriota bacterium]
MTPEVPIFFDPRGRRRRRARWTWITFAAAATLLIAAFVASVLINPVLPSFNLQPAAALPRANDAAHPQPTPPPKSRREQAAKQEEEKLRRTLSKTEVVPGKRPKLLPVAPPPKYAPAVAKKVDPQSQVTKPITVGFFVNWDDSSYASLKRNLSQLDWLSPEWIRLQDGEDPLVRDISRPALDLVRRERPEMPILPLVQNYQNEVWNPDLLVRAISTEQSRQKLINALTQLVDENKFGGVCIDFEEVPAKSQPDLLRFVQELHAAFQPRGFVVAQAAPFDDSDWNYRAYADATDYLMLMAYDEHWESSTPGSVASQPWFERTLAERMSELDPAKTIVAIGNYGYDWQEGETEAEEVTFQEAVLAARDHPAAQADETIK